MSGGVITGSRHFQRPAFLFHNISSSTYNNPASDTEREWEKSLRPNLGRPASLFLAPVTGGIRNDTGVVPTEQGDFVNGNSCLLEHDTPGGRTWNRTSTDNSAHADHASEVPDI